MSDPTWWNAAPGELYGDSTDVPMCDHCGNYRVFEKGQLCGMCILSAESVTRCFTFGFAHAHPSGFVRITAPTAMQCRKEMIRRYGKQWAFEYSEEQIADQMKRFPQMYEVKE